MRRRDFIMIAGSAVAIAGAGVSMPRTARAQASQQMWRVSLLLGLTDDNPETNMRLKAFRLVE